MKGGHTGGRETQSGDVGASCAGQGAHTRWPSDLKVGTYMRDTFEIVLKRFRHILRVDGED